MSINIHFFYLKACPSLKERTRLKSFLKTIFLCENKKVTSLTYIFCSDKYLLQINKEYLKHDFYTDIITFDLSENPATSMGEIYISVDRVRENAKKRELNVKDELHRVIFHGALHLCGYKDKKAADKKEMSVAEDKYLKLYFS